MRRAFFVLIILLISIPSVFSSCTNGTNSVAVTPNVDAQTVLKKSIEAMEQIDTYTLNMNLTEDDNVTRFKGSPQQTSFEKSTYWNSTRTVNIKGEQIELSMDSQASAIKNGAVIGQDSRETWDEKAVGGYYYIEGISPPVYHYNTIEIGWSKTEGKYPYWKNNNQLPYLINLLKSTTNAELKGTERINGIDCFHIDARPSSEAIAEWAVSQRQAATGSMLVIPGSESESDVYSQYYKGVTIDSWIGIDTFRVIKTDINVTFDITWDLSKDAFDPSLPIGATPPVTGLYYETISKFHGIELFSDYNQPVNIKPPPDSEIVD